MLNSVRAHGKRMLGGTSPKTYRAAKMAFGAFKLLIDRIAFRIQHPRAAYVRYSKRELDKQRREGFRSQYGQDYYLWTVLFNRCREGIFVDIGANDPVQLSNTYALEQRGWHGYAFDPLSRFEDAWHVERKAEFHRVAVDREGGRRTFVEIVTHRGWEHTLSSFKEHVRDEDVRMYGSKEYEVRTAPLADLVPAGVTIDLLLVDVEGAEEAVLAGVDFDRLRPRVVMVENVQSVGGGRVVRQQLGRAGYRIKARIGGCDDVFVDDRSPTEVPRESRT